MVGPEGPLADGQGPLVERPGRREVSLFVEEDSERLQRRREVKRDDVALVNGYGPLVERPGTYVIPLFGEKVRKVVQCHRDVGVVGPEGPLARSQGPLVEQAGVCVVTLSLQESTEAVESDVDCGVDGVEGTFKDDERPVEERPSLSEVPLQVVEDPEGVESRSYPGMIRWEDFLADCECLFHRQQCTGVLACGIGSGHATHERVCKGEGRVGRLRGCHLTVCQGAVGHFVSTRLSRLKGRSLNVPSPMVVRVRPDAKARFRWAPSKVVIVVLRPRR